MKNIIYQYGERSNRELATAHLDMQKIMALAITRTPVDFGIHQGARTIEKQQEYFDKGRSKISPKKYKTPEALAAVAKHITIAGSRLYGKSRAVDLHVAEKYGNEPLTWDEVHIGVVAGVIISCAKELYYMGEVTHLIRWGADWDGDGIIGLDHKLQDFPHFELYKPE